MNPQQRFAELLMIPTVSSINPEDEDEEAFRRFPELLMELYPDAHRVMERRLIGGRGIVYRWEGSDASLEPMLGMAHYDVVPPGNPEDWEYPPFGGIIAGGRIHGRGTLDDKGMLCAWMEAVERLVQSGFQPKRTMLLAFGGDEESTGFRGARLIARHFADEGMRFAFILDEGGAVATDQFSSFTGRPIALIGTAEKGYLSLRIGAGGVSGHASSPPKRTAVGLLAAALVALERHPFPKRLTTTVRDMLRSIGRGTAGLKGFLLRHPRLFRPLVLSILGSAPATAGLVRTTLAPTMISGGERENVLPDAVEAVVNIRILPGECVAGVISRVRLLSGRAAGSAIRVDPIEGSMFEPVGSSPAGGAHWNLLARSAREVWSGCIVAPYLMTATTDSRWYRDLSDFIFRFIPMEVGRLEQRGVHSIDESIPLDTWLRSIDFLEKVIRDE